jgi:DHA3 family multidrug efflux protein-like MFS transporter
MWGIVLGVTSTGFIVGGLVVSKKGLGRNPLRTLLLVNVAIGAVGMIFAIREFWLLFVVGMLAYMSFFPVVEAAEQTVIQRVVPFNRQGRVFGFAQSIEAAASPITAFLIGPIAQFWLLPYMNRGGGNQRFGWLLGDGQARGMALIFIIAGFVGLVVALLAFRTRSYVRLSEYYAKA